MSNGLDTLSRVSGISKEGMKKIWGDVKENHKKLNGCKRPHDFNIDLNPEKKMGKKWECTKCGGTVDGIHKKWYEEGLCDGGTKSS